MNTIGKKHESGAYLITTPKGRELWLMNTNYMWCVLMPPYVLHDWHTFHAARRGAKTFDFDELIEDLAKANT